MDNRYLLQFQNSITKKWSNQFEGNFDQVEAKYNATINSPECERFKHKWRMIEFSVIHAN